MAVETHIEGLEELSRNMKKLPLALQKKWMGRATAAAAKVVVDAARSAAPFKTGTLRKSITKRKLRARQSKFDSGHIVGWMRGRSRSRGDQTGAYYAHFVEFGTAHQAAQPHLSPALELHRSQATRAMADKIRQGLAAETSRL